MLLAAPQPKKLVALQQENPDFSSCSERVAAAPYMPICEKMTTARDPKQGLYRILYVTVGKCMCQSNNFQTRQGQSRLP